VVRARLCKQALLLVCAALAGAGQTLKLGKPVISQVEDGPAMTAGQKPVPGETVYFAVTVEGFKAVDGKVRITGHAQLFDSRGIAASSPEEVVIGTSLYEEDKEYKPRIRAEFPLPAIAPGGTWHVRYDAEDLQNSQKQSGEAPFAVEGHAPGPAAALEIRGFGFYRTQSDETPLTTVAYRAGDMVWVRFEIAGYKYGEQNSIDVAYDVAVSNSEGRVLFEQPDAANEKSQAFYPQPWVPGEFNLSLQSTMSRGTYTVTITARDGIGSGQTAKASAQFHVQ
jgi:hypothetical protein